MVSTASLAVVYRPVDQLIPYARNARTHSEAQVAQIAGSIREFGFTAPVLLDGENGILAGHGRVLAARKLGMDEVPCIELAHLSEAQRRAYILADNQLTLNAGWDEALLRVEVADLAEMAFDLSLIGFAKDVQSALLGPPRPRKTAAKATTRSNSGSSSCAATRRTSAKPSSGWSGSAMSQRSS
jgi:ParB-like chromosome segregation protein Spo0J